VMIFHVWVVFLWWFRDLTATVFVRGTETPSRRKRSLVAHVSFAPDPPQVWYDSSRDPALELPDDQGSVQAGTKLSFERAGRWESSCEIKVRLCAEGDRRPMSPRLCEFSVRSLHPNTPPPLSLARRLVHILPERR